jgi:hypothetical protein
VSFPNERGLLLLMEAAGFEVLALESVTSAGGSSRVYRSLFRKPERSPEHGGGGAGVASNETHAFR